MSSRWACRASMPDARHASTFSSDSSAVAKLRRLSWKRLNSHSEDLSAPHLRRVRGRPRATSHISIVRDRTTADAGKGDEHERAADGSPTDSRKAPNLSRQRVSLRRAWFCCTCQAKATVMAHRKYAIL